MVFFVNAASTVLGVPENLRLQFSTRPTLQEFAAAVESHFTTAAGVLFLVDTMMLLDEYTSTWLDLYSSLQLSTDCQVYVFPRKQHKYEQKEKKQQKQLTAVQIPPMRIPPPSRTISCIITTPLTHNTSTSLFLSSSCCCCCCSWAYSHTKWMNTSHECKCKYSDNSNNKDISNSPSSTQDVIMHSSRTMNKDAAKRRWMMMGFGERLRTAFNELDIQQKGYLVYMDFKRALDAQQKVFINHSAETLFTLADRDGDNGVSYKDWASFAATHSAVMEEVLTLIPLLPWHSAKRDRDCSSFKLPVLHSRSILLKNEEARLAQDVAVVDAAAVVFNGK
ncbi:BILBO1 [Trypanosoma melophagium]|uniref:BILBO1 n=1 Tax=Trypanosoma melophagium TaxID=715481 RepID=UPI00351A4E8C|nr:BILBO1 [Trypanosoma melophagium]